MDDADVVASLFSVRPPRGDNVLRLNSNVDNHVDAQGDVDVALDVPTSDPRRKRALRELAEEERNAAFVDWVERHLWTYVSLSPLLLRAANSVRAVVSGEKMGLPMSESLVRDIELSFRSTHTLSAVSTKTGLCNDAPTATTTTNKERQDHPQKLVSGGHPAGDQVVRRVDVGLRQRHRSVGQLSRAPRLLQGPR